jgi:NAD(P)-dependent dehydrogenase (short-subunit alcohol dehydrogenase family)
MKTLLSNKNILVTGVGKGIGYETTQKIIDCGGFVYGITKNKNDVKKFSKNLNCKIFVGDASNDNNIKKIFKFAHKNKKIIHGLVNNAGRRQRKEFEKITKKDLDFIINSNIKTVFNNMQIFFNYAKKIKNSYSIVNIGSIVGKIGFENLVGYSMTKSALIGLTKSFAVEKKRFLIRANLINPGFIKTSFYKDFKKNKKKLYNWTLSRIPSKKWGEPNDIAILICFLLSDHSKYINGEEINIDGGWLSS